MSEERFVSRGFVGKRRGGDKKDRIPPVSISRMIFLSSQQDQLPTRLSIKWTFTIDGLVKEKVSWTWDEFTQTSHAEICGGYFLRYQVDASRHEMGRRQSRYASRTR